MNRKKIILGNSPDFEQNSDLLRANMCNPELKEIEKTEHYGLQTPIWLQYKTGTEKIKFCNNTI